MILKAVWTAKSAAVFLQFIKQSPRCPNRDQIARNEHKHSYILEELHIVNTRSQSAIIKCYISSSDLGTMTTYFKAQVAGIWLHKGIYSLTNPFIIPNSDQNLNNKTKFHSGSQEVTNLFLQHYQYEWVGFPFCTHKLKATESGSSGIQQLTSSNVCCQQSIHTRLCEAEYKPLLKEVWRYTSADVFRTRQ